MRMSTAALLVLVAIPARAEPLPPQITASMAEDKKGCGGAASFTPGFITRKDVNGDGVPDYILDYAHFVCDGSTSTYCGSAGCLTVVWASHNGGFVKAFEENAQAITYRTIKGRPAMVLGLHGSSCGKVGSAPCGMTMFWNGSEFSLAH